MNDRDRRIDELMAAIWVDDAPLEKAFWSRRREVLEALGAVWRCEERYEVNNTVVECDPDAPHGICGWFVPTGGDEEGEE